MSTFDRAYGNRARQDRREHLLAAHLPLVKHVVGRVAMELPESVLFDSLEAGGLFGLLDAVSKFDPSKEHEFTDQARIRVRQGIDDALRRDWSPSEDAVKQFSQISEIYLRLSSPVNFNSLTAAASLSPDEAIDSLIALRLQQRLRPVPEYAPIPFTLSETRAAEWAEGKLDAISEIPFSALDAVASRLRWIPKTAQTVSSCSALSLRRRRTARTRPEAPAQIKRTVDGSGTSAVS